MTDWPGTPAQAAPQWPGSPAQKSTAPAPQTQWPGTPKAAAPAPAPASAPQAQWPGTPKTDATPAPQMQWPGTPKPAEPAAAPRSQTPPGQTKFESAARSLADGSGEKRLVDQANAFANKFFPSLANIGQVSQRRQQETLDQMKHALGRDIGGELKNIKSPADLARVYVHYHQGQGEAASAVVGQPFGQLAGLAENFPGRAVQTLDQKITGRPAKLLSASNVGDALSMMAPAEEVRPGVPKPDAPYAGERPHGPVVGDEPDMKVRADNALFRLGGSAAGDKLQALEFMDRLPKEVRDPKVQEELYGEIEKKMVDPNHQIPAHLQGAFKAMEPWYKEQTDLANKLRKRGDPEIEEYLHDTGYVARREVGHNPQFDVAEGPTQGRGDVITGAKANPGAAKRGLSTTASALKQRTAGFIATDAKGKETFFRGEVPKTDLKGRPYAKVRQATTAEIEKNTDLRYSKNALVNTVDNVIRLRRVERNYEVLDLLKDQMQRQGLAHREEWVRPGPNGERILQANPKGRAPDHFVELHNIPQLKGWKFDPKVANILKDYYPPKGADLDTFMTKVNRALTASLFITPVPHVMNVGAHWFVGRGWDWISPKGYARLQATGARAAQEVLSGGPEYRRMLREGSGLMYGDVQTKNFYDLMLKKGAGELVGDPKAVDAMNQSFGVKLSPVEWGRALYSASNKALWAGNDIFLLQRQFELEAKGMSPRKAILEAEKDIPNYRIPSEVLGSREVAEAMKNPNVVMFGRYKYGQLRAWGSIFNELYKGDPAAKKEALGKFVMTMTLANVAYPIADQGVKAATGNPDARMKRAGPLSLTDSAWQFAQGQKDWASLVSSWVSLPPVTTAGVEAASDVGFGGRKIIDPDATAKGKAVQAGEYIAGKFYPSALALEAAKPGGAGRAAGRLVGVENPNPDAKAARDKYAPKNRKAALRREARDPVEQALGGP